MSCQTIYRFRIHLQESHIHSSIPFQWMVSHNQHFSYNDLMKKLQRLLKNRFSLHDYNVFMIDSTGDTRYHLHDDDSLGSAFSSLRLQRLTLLLERKTSSSSTPSHQTYYSTAPLIKPKVKWWHEHLDNYIYSKQQRKDSGIDLDSSLFLCAPGTMSKDDCQANNITNRYSYQEKTFYHKQFNNDEESDVPSATYSPHSSPSTIASSSPPSPMVLFSNSDITPILTDSNSSKPPSSSWSPTNLTSLRSRSQATSPLPVYFCNHMIGDGNICGQTFQRPYDLARHQSIHLKNRPFVYCQQCNKRFTRVDALRRHERVQGHFPSQKSNQQKKPHCYHPNRHHHYQSTSSSSYHL